ncbi:hypothetical protein [Bacillus thuringiensis]|uniref:hypothetical protein n=1 Tax=Bacillus thuringiensis TaxID=1428 RepID=UPI000676D613|nr:hypothetical protein [Bacillus thuringiensis]AKR12557.1 hypothetical protein AC241_27820 [Bacillus thuringiensis]MBZ8123143.1 hypothetical protein [Bacillus thuringiensis]MED2868020.1 hypothetical protein [Bacillus thuringiensis]
MKRNMLKASKNILLAGCTFSLLVGCSSNNSEPKEGSKTTTSANESTTKDQVANGSKIGETSNSDSSKKDTNAKDHKEITIDQFGGESFSNLLDDRKVKELGVARKGDYIYVMFQKYIQEENKDKTFVSIGKIDDKEGKWIIKDQHFANGEDGVTSTLFGDAHIISNGLVARTALMDENAKMVEIDTNLQSSSSNNISNSQNTSNRYYYVQTSNGSALLVQEGEKVFLHLDDGTKKEIKNLKLKDYGTNNIYIDLKQNLLYDGSGKTVFDINKGDYVYDKQGQKLKYGINYAQTLVAANAKYVIANTNNGTKLKFDVYNTTTGGNAVRSIESEAIQRASIGGVLSGSEAHLYHFSLTGDYIHYVGLIEYKGKPSIQYKKIYAGE